MDAGDAWDKLFADAGLERRLFHDLRRSGIRNAIRRRVDRDTVMRMSGHLTPHVFSRYNIVATDDLRAAARLIEAGAKTAPETKTGTTAAADGAEPRLQ